MGIGLRIAAVALLQTLILCAMVGVRQWTLATGVPVVLETRPVDPRSLFSGDYVRLNYVVSDLRLDELSGDKDFHANDKIYVVLVPDGEYWKAISVHHLRPEPGAGGTAIKATVTYVAENMWDPAQSKSIQARNLRVKYGVEDYFVQEGTGRQLERPRADEKVSIQIAVDRFGNAGIRAVLVNGQSRFRETLL
jgi:uncharacterized membrane-anchored protein